MRCPPNAPPRALCEASPARPSIAAELFVVAAGGAIGACSRALTYHVVSHVVSRPLAGWLGRSTLESTALVTLGINVVGAMLLGMLHAGLRRRSASPLLRPFLAVGVLGSYTTYATLMVESRRVAFAMGPSGVVVLLLSSLLLGLVAFVIGERLIDRPLAARSEGDGDGA